jgi:hypothetical protein
MAKKQKSQQQKGKASRKEKEQVSQSPNPSPGASGLGVTAPTGQEFHLEQVAGEPAPTVTTEEGVGVQVGQSDQNQQQQQQQQEQLERTVHPELGTVFESNVTKYKNRTTEFLTLPMKLVTQPRYPFKGDKKTKVRITLSDDGNRLIVEKSWE